MDAICWVETNHRNVINPKDGGSPSYGLCQIKLETANWIHYKHKLGNEDLTEADLMKPEVNIFYAGLYFKYQWDKYKDLKCAISAYNAGRCIKGNMNTYVKKVLQRLGLNNFSNLFRRSTTNIPAQTKIYRIPQVWTQSGILRYPEI